MFSNNPRKDLFRVVMPDTFFIKEITNKYDNFLKQKHLPLDTIQEVLLESIKGFDTPDFGVTPSQQQLANDGLRFDQPSLPKESIQRATEKTFQLRFRHSDAYLTYFLMLEHFFARLKFGEKAARKHFGTIILELQSPVGNSINRIRYEKCHLIGVPPLSLDYALPNQDTSEFACNIAYTKFSTSFDVPELKLNDQDVTIKT